jgi:hypothetical protein
MFDGPCKRGASTLLAGKKDGVTGNADPDRDLVIGFFCRLFRNSSRFISAALLTLAKKLNLSLPDDWLHSGVPRSVIRIL